MSRNLQRSMARAEYAKFAKRWRQEQRLAGVYGKPNNFKRPKFNEWYTMHEKNLEMMKESAPADVLEYVGEDPWANPPEVNLAPIQGEPEGERRGVVTLDISSGEEEGE